MADADEWICERCGWPAPPRLARLFTIPAPRVRDREEAELIDELLEEELEPAEFDADELGLDTEEEEY